jgi:hydrogen cyanide synthase HcnC
MLQKAHGEVIVGSTTERTEFDVSVRYSDMRNLAAGAARAVPALRRATIKRAWAGLRPGTPDELPILGPDHRVTNLFHATGGFRTGIVAAPLSGEVVACCVAGERPPAPVEPFLAARFFTAAARA